MSHDTVEVAAEPEMLDLAQNRTIILHTKSGVKKLNCRRLTSEDWGAYFAAIYVTTKQEGKDLVKLMDTESARLMLAERAMTSAEGYKLEDGSELTSVPDWQGLLPLAHRLAVGNVLTSALPSSSQADEDVIYTNGRPVSIDAVWGSDEAGGARLFKGLVHVLKAPSQSQHLRFARATNQTRVLGGSRSGTTMYLGGQDTVVQLYDELVVSVEGYSVKGEKLGGREAIRREMDAHHKFMAAIQVLQPANENFAKPDEKKMAEEAAL